MKNKIPYWFAKKIADIINFKYRTFKREKAPDPKWTDWKDCQKFSRFSIKKELQYTLFLLCIFRRRLLL